MSIAFASVIVALLVVAIVFFLRKQKANIEADINEMDDVPFFVSTLISILYENKHGASIKHSDSKVEPYGGVGALLATREQLTNICSAAHLHQITFVENLLESEFLLVKLGDLIDWQAIYVKTAPDNYVYEFTRGPDYEAAQRNLPHWLQGFRSHISGDLSKWSTQSDISNSIAYMITLTSMQGEVFTVSFVLDAVDPTKTDRPVDFEFVTVSPFKKAR